MRLELKKEAFVTALIRQKGTGWVPEILLFQDDCEVELVWKILKSAVRLSRPL